MQPRMQHPAAVIPDAMKAIQSLMAAVMKAGVPKKTLDLVHLRASQINGCANCIEGGARHAKEAGETDERLFTVAAWREAPYYSDSERAALALAESITRLSDREDPVPDAVWNEATRHFDEKGMAALILWIGTTNLFNRMNVAVKQLPGGW